MGMYKFRFDITPETTTLVYLSEVYHVDLVTLLLIYEKYGKDVFFFFYLFAGKQVNFPKASKLYRVIQSCRALTKKGVKVEITTQQEKQVLERLNKLLDKKDNCYLIEMEVSHDRDSEVRLRGADSKPKKEPEEEEDEKSTDAS